MIFCLVNDMIPIFIEAGGRQNAIKWLCLKACYTLSDIYKCITLLISLKWNLIYLRSHLANYDKHSNFKTILLLYFF